MAVGLANGLTDANEDGDLKQRDALLDELRQLAQAHSEDAEVRRTLARSLNDTLNQSHVERKPVRCDALLKELRDLQHRDPPAVGVRQIFAVSLYNAMLHAKEAERRDALLEELRELSRNQPVDTALLRMLAIALQTRVRDVEDERTPERQAALLAELNELVQQLPPP